MPAALTESSERAANQPGQQYDAASRSARPAPPDAAQAPEEPEPGRLGWIDLRQWGIRPKLVTVVLIPTIAALFLVGLRMENAVSISASYTRLDGLARVLPQVNATVQRLQTERDVTAGVMAAPQDSDVTSLTSLRATTDGAVAQVRQRIASVDSTRDSALRSSLTDVLNRLNGLGDLRAAADDGRADVSTVAARYTATIGSLLALTNDFATQSRDGSVTRQAVALQSLAGISEAVSQERRILYSALLSGGLFGDSYTDLAGANAALQAATANFRATADGTASDDFRTTVSGSWVDTVTKVVQQAILTHSSVNLGVDAKSWRNAATQVLDQVGQVQSRQTGRLTDKVHSLGQRARTDALISAAIIYVILGLALLATLLVARSILRPLRQLRSAALDVAYTRLPDTVRRVQDGEITDATAEVPPIDVVNEDEIGEVARAFEAVHVEAVRLAGQQAVMRGNVNKMFVNLSRRSQSLVERQLRLIDKLESSEQDADQLSNLFQLDHLATRMRRNDENLLVLAGADSGRRRRDAVPMLDVLRAASAEVEQYSRVRLTVQTGYELTGAAANDVVHLIAELLENATNFSPPSSLVWLRSHSLGANGEMLIEVEDHGIGMTATELRDANRELTNPRGMEVEMTQLMGLFVVARLAQRHGIAVQMQSGESGGLIAYVRLPPGLARPVDISALTDSGSKPEPVVPATSPIFDALQSEWFTPRNTEPAPAAAAASGASYAPASEPAPAPKWRSPADEGWRVAAAAQSGSTQSDVTTASGLPMRVPGRNLIPGSAGGSAASGNRNGATKQRAAPDARGLSSYQQGISRGRTESRDPEQSGAHHATENGESRAPGQSANDHVHDEEEIRR